MNTRKAQKKMTALNAKQLKDYKDNGYIAPIDILSLEEAEEIPLTFRYELLYNKEGVVDEDNVDEFRDLIGDILLTLIEEGLEHDQVRINSIGNNDT